MSIERSCSQSSSSPRIRATWPMVKTAAIAAMLGCSTVRLRTWPPVPRQELVDPAGRVLSDPGQHVGQPGLRIDIVHLGGDDQAVHRGGALPAMIRRDLIMPGV